MDTETIVERFVELFAGGELAHGRWDPEKGASTVRAPAPRAAYEEHLRAAGTGLGLVPVRRDGTCRFAAIDIDVDTTDHRELAARVAARRLPLVTCRSKSGGAHLYAFFPEPGAKAGHVQRVLKRWAAALGYPQAEVFPKQARVGGRNLGNWINLPYHGALAGETTRYAVAGGRALTLGEFLDSVPAWTEDVDDAAPPSKEESKMPPCLALLSKEGVQEGFRNQTLFNIGVYFRKSSPADWKDLAARWNGERFNPPLGHSEVTSVLRSADRKLYQYTCDQEPLCSRCDRRACLLLPHGVGHKPWEDPGNWHEALVSNLRKICTDPPRYVVEVNGQDVEAVAEDLLEWRRFARRCFETINLVVGPRRKGWMQELKDLTEKIREIDAPAEASFRGVVLEKVREFLRLSERSMREDDVLRGLPWLVPGEDTIVFRPTDLYKYIGNSRMQQKVPEPYVYQLLHFAGASSTTRRVCGKPTRVWLVPRALAEMQARDFEVQDVRRMEELL